MKTMKNGTKVTVIGSTGNKYTVTKTKNGKMECSCPRWIHTTPRKNCKHILSALSGKPVTKAEKKEKQTKKVAPKAKLVVKAIVSPVRQLAIKQASEKIFKLISSAPGKLTRRSLVKKTQLDRSTVSAACEALWASKRIHKNRSKQGWLKAGYIVRK